MATTEEEKKANETSAVKSAAEKIMGCLGNNQAKDAAESCPDEKSKIAECEKKASEYMEIAQRLQAEFENYRKRMERSQEEMAKYSCAGIIKDLLPVLDTMDDAIKHSEQGKHLHHEGIKGVRKQFMAILERNGLSEIQTRGKKFDPEFHDCAMMKCEGGKEDDLVLEEIMKGYLIHNKVLRPAMVIVNKKEEKDDKNKEAKKNEDTTENKTGDK